MFFDWIFPVMVKKNRKPENSPTMFVFYPKNNGDIVMTLSYTEVPKNDEAKSTSYLFFEFHAHCLDAKRRILYKLKCQCLLRLYHNLATVYGSRDSSHLDR